MTSSSATLPVPRPPTVRSRPAATAGWTFVVTGIVHGLAALMPWPDSARPGVEAMGRSTFAIGGVSRSLSQLFNGFSFAMVPLLIAFGAVVLLLLRRGPLPRDIAWLGLAVSLALLLIAVALLPTPPIVTMSIASAAFIVSLRR